MHELYKNIKYSVKRTYYILQYFITLKIQKGTYNQYSVINSYKRNR